jgi:hypothetical protein
MFWLYVTYTTGLIRAYEVPSRDTLSVPDTCSVIAMNTWQELVSTQGDDAGALASLNLTEDSRDRDYQDRLPHEEGFGT